MANTRAKMIIRVFIPVTLLLLSSLFFVSLNVKLTLAQTSTPTLWVKIHRIQAVDPIESWLEGEADWHYYIWVWSGENWLSVDDTTPSNQKDVIVDTAYSFDVETVSSSVRIALLEDDFLTNSDVADISGYFGGGYDNYDGTLPRGAEYRGTYDLKTNDLTGDEVIVESGYFKTSGDYDDSTDVDENDANLWFSIWDNYDSPQANAGLDQTVYTYDKANFAGSASTASSGSTLVKYQWDFENDGIFDAEGETTSYTYTEKGEYYAVLKVTDSLGETDTDTVRISVRNREPDASFTYSPSEPTMKDVVNFVDTSEDQDGTIDSWSWELGDGTTSDLQNPTHQYSDKGTFTARLTVTDNDGATDAITKTVTVYNLEPIANFSFSSTSATVGEDIQFTDESEDPEEKPLTCLWDFGDGYTSTITNPTHKYEEAGTYTVKLTVTDDEGTTDTTSQTITVREKSFLEQTVVPWAILITIVIAGVIIVGAALFISKKRKPT